MTFRFLTSVSSAGSVTFLALYSFLYLRQPIWEHLLSAYSSFFKTVLLKVWSTGWLPVCKLLVTSPPQDKYRKWESKIFITIWYCCNSQGHDQCTGLFEQGRNQRAKSMTDQKFIKKNTTSKKPGPSPQKTWEILL